MVHMRVLISVERSHRAYGEVIAEAIGTLRPHLKVSVVAPEGFAEGLTRLRPERVACDQPDPAGPDETLAWVDFLVDSDRPATVRVGGRLRELVNPSLMSCSRSSMRRGRSPARYQWSRRREAG
jgi:hypothetical protein